MGKEIVICAAINFPSYHIVVRGHRHSDCVHTLLRMGKDTMHVSSQEGFITSRNRFVGRKEGYEIQITAGVKSVLEDTDHADGAYLNGELYSEDLY